MGSSLLFGIGVLDVPVLPLPQFWGAKLGVLSGFLCIFCILFCEKLATRQKQGHLHCGVGGDFLSTLGCFPGSCHGVLTDFLHFFCKIVATRQK